MKATRCLALFGCGGFPSPTTRAPRPSVLSLATPQPQLSPHQTPQTMKDVFFHELSAQLDTPERSFEYTPSSILAISANNERPTLEDLHAARHAIENASADRAQYAGLILRLESVLDQARKGLAQVDSHLEAHKSVLAPIRGLPAELLLDIFRLTFYSKRGYGFNLTSYLRGPWVLSHVCRCWRDVVVGCPTLWSSFTILSATRYTGNLFTLSLSRSQMHPLSFYLSLDDFPYDEARYRATIFVYRTLLEHSNRWKDVVLHLDGSLALNLPRAQNKLDILHRVEVSVMNEEERTSITDLFVNAPKLQHITFVSAFRGCAIIALPWSQLSSLHVCSITITPSFIEALGSAVVLEHFTVRCFEGTHIQTKTPCIALLPKLRYMNTTCPKLLAFLHLPALEELICEQFFTIELNFPEFIWDTFCQGRSAFAALTSLSVFDNGIMPKYLLLVLQTLLTLEQLKIEIAQQLRETYLDPLLLRLRSQPHLLPRLRSFTFEEHHDAGRDCQCNNIETSTRLVDVMHGRQGVLRTVHIELNHRLVFMAETRLRLKALERDGLDFEMSKSRPPVDETDSEGEESLANVSRSLDSDSDNSDDSSDDSE